MINVNAIKAGDTFRIKTGEVIIHIKEVGLINGVLDGFLVELLSSKNEKLCITIQSIQSIKSLLEQGAINE